MRNKAEQDAGRTAAEQKLPEAPLESHRMVLDAIQPIAGQGSTDASHATADKDASGEGLKTLDGLMRVDAVSETISRNGLQSEDQPGQEMPGRGGSHEGSSGAGERRLADAAPFVVQATTTLTNAPSLEEGSAVSQSAHPGWPELETRLLECAVELKRLGSRSVAVVIKPDSNTELCLQLRQVGGGIEAVADLRRGDIAALEAHWNELRQDLAQRGIQLGALRNSNPDAAGQQMARNFSRQEQPRGQEREVVLPIRQSTPPLAIRMAEANGNRRARLAASRWEGWA